MINLTLSQAIDTIAKLEQENRNLKATLKIIPPDRLEALAHYLDIIDQQKGSAGNEVQIDLRKLAVETRKLLFL